MGLALLIIPMMFRYKNYLLTLILSGSFIYSFSQYSIQLRIISFPPSHITEDVFVAGNFNQWDPGNEQYKFMRTGDTFFINITGLKKDIYEFKFTRGKWSNVEVSVTGGLIQNRFIKLASDTIVTYSIDGWADDFSQPVKKHTASKNVQLLDSSFFMPQLLRKRRLWVYLPPAYGSGKQKYPVIYMNDGQNLFDDYTSGYGEWGIDELMDSLVRQGKPASIIVGIDNGEKRMNEYNPYSHKDFGKGEGDQYLLFIIETLKPFIDKKYRTLSSKENTIIAGSSMGGLISYYAALKYPKVFGKAGIFSPSISIGPEIKQLTDSLGEKLKGQLFFYAGVKEGESMVSDMQEICEKLGQDSRSLIYSVTDPDGKHNEQYWHKWFTEFYLWIMGTGLSYQINTDN
ncbi:MAG: alpha/beta hydrolase-fold protein [Ferruginibacter sp.]